MGVVATPTASSDSSVISHWGDPMSTARSESLSRVGPLGVVAVVWVAIAILFPTSEPNSTSASGVPSGGGSGGVPAFSGEQLDDGTTSSTDGSGAALGAGPKDAGGSGPSVGSTATPVASPSSSATGGNAALAAAGKSRDGRDCAPGVRQIAVSSYATQCRAASTGDNGGATFKGVTGDEIVIVERRFPETANGRAVDQVNQQAGVASSEQNDEVFEVFKAYFNENYELYGRKVKWVVYESQFGNSTNEAQSKGREEACLDADVVANELNAFAVVGTRAGAVSGPFAECAAERGLMVFNGAAYFPERFYAERHPYVWAYTMECERISYQVAEYIGKRLGRKKAQWAGDPILAESPRAYATYVPNNDEYQYCVDVNLAALKRDYGIESSSRYNYTLDVSRFPDEAARGAVQFKADGATTVVLACDPISVIFLTQAAVKQAYFPEWYLIGVAAQDTDLYGQLYDQQATDGHMFGMSQLGATKKVVGPGSEPGDVYKHITGKDIYPGATGGYIGLILTYNLLQEAGPGLTPDAVGAGALNMAPGGAPNFAYGYVSFADGPQGTPGTGDHTAVDDSREIYWTQSQVSPDNGTPGTFVETYNGKRFRNGEWPQENPPVYPEG